MAQPLWCQVTNIVYPDLYTMYQANMYLVNPAYVPNEARTDLNAFYKFQVGAFKEVSTMNFSAAKVFRKESGSAQSIRITVLDEKQGPYISSPRGYANYGYELALGEETSLAAGLALGFVGQNYSGVSTTGSTNFYLPDASAGLLFKWKQFNIGMASQQLLNSKTNTFYSQLELKRYYHFHLQHQVELGMNLKWNYYGMYRLFGTIPNELLVGTSLLLHDAIGLGVAVRSNSGISLYSEFMLDSERDRIKIIFNYNSPFFQLIPAYQSSIELGVGYVFK
jgi:type IX secretion system PorP/SprF family membrane protein